MIAGNGPQAEYLHEVAAASPAAARIRFLDDVDDDEKPHLMAGCAAFVLPSKPRPEFVETFGIALVEKMLAGGGPVITTDTGGIGEAVGDTALIVPVDSPSSITAALDLAVTMPLPERADMAARARAHALQFDRMNVFDQLLERVDKAVTPRLGGLDGHPAATGLAVSTPAPAGSLRSRVEDASRPLLQRLHAMPQPVVPLLTIVLIAVGVLAPLPVGLVALALVLLLVGWIAYLSWPVASTGRPALAGADHRAAHHPRGGPLLAAPAPDLAPSVT